jgi:hypothetical protein
MDVIPQLGASAKIREFWEYVSTHLRFIIPFDIQKDLPIIILNKNKDINDFVMSLSPSGIIFYRMRALLHQICSDIDIMISTNDVCIESMASDVIQRIKDDMHLNAPSSTICLTRYWFILSTCLNQKWHMLINYMYNLSQNYKFPGPWQIIKFYMPTTLQAAFSNMDIDELKYCFHIKDNTAFINQLTQAFATTHYSCNLIEPTPKQLFDALRNKTAYIMIFRDADKCTQDAVITENEMKLFISDLRKYIIHSAGELFCNSLNTVNINISSTAYIANHNYHIKPLKYLSIDLQKIFFIDKQKCAACGLYELHTHLAEASLYPPGKYCTFCYDVYSIVYN